MADHRGETPGFLLAVGGCGAKAESNWRRHAMEEQPITPHAVPVFDAEGNLTYIGDDGRRYVVGPLPEFDEANVEQVMQRLLAGQSLFAELEALCAQWLDQVCGSDLSRSAALALLLSSLEMALDPGDEETFEG